MNKLGTIGAKFDPKLTKVVTIGSKSSQVGTIGGGSGPRVDLDILSYGQS